MPGGLSDHPRLQRTQTLLLAGQQPWSGEVTMKLVQKIHSLVYSDMPATPTARQAAVLLTYCRWKHFALPNQLDDGATLQIPCVTNHPHAAMVAISHQAPLSLLAGAVHVRELANAEVTAVLQKTWLQCDLQEHCRPSASSQGIDHHT